MDRLKLSDWANVAEIIAATAITISLIFVGLELQRNTLASEAATREAINQKDLEFLSLKLDSSVLSRAHANLENNQPLSPLEESQLMNQEYVNFISFEHSYYQYRKGVLEPKEWSRHENIVRHMIQSSQYSKTMWSQKAHTFSGEFRTLVNDFIENSDLPVTEKDPELLIEEIYNSWVETTNNKDIDGWVSYLAPGAVFLPPDSPALVSEEAIRQYYETSFSDPNFTLDCKQLSAEINPSGKMAWARGICKATFTGPSGEVAHGASKWAKVWVKQDDGKWKCRMNTWNNNP